MVEAKSCPECGLVLPENAPEGLCPRCLLQSGLANGQDTPIRAKPVATSIFQGPQPAPIPAELSAHFPQLEILELLGQGGMGAVYKARQKKLDRLVALKILSEEAGSDSAFAERFTREARALARLNHPNIVTVHDFGETDGLYYFLMEFVDGVNLRQLLNAGTLRPYQALQIIPQICDALQYAHEEDIVHRDIKPENILLDKKGRVKIADFGLARLVGLTPAYLTLTGSHQVMGTLYYMAPEQMQRSHTVDHRADIFSLGVVFYEMLTGELPLGRFAPPSHKVKIDGRIDEIVLRALAKEPEKRFQRISEMKKDLEFLALNSPGETAPGASPSPAAYAGFHSIPFETDHFEENDEYRQAKGLIRLEEKSLVLEYHVAESWGDNSKSVLKENSIAISDISSIYLEYNWFSLSLTVRVARLSLLSGIPTTAKGQVKLKIMHRDRFAAEQLIAEIQRKQGWNASRGTSSPVAADAAFGKVPDVELIRMGVKGAAAGLFLTGLLALLSWALILTLVTTHRYYNTWRPEGYYEESLGSAHPGLFFILLVPVSFLFFGAAKMRNLTGYEFAMLATILAMLPWNPAWIVGLIAGGIALKYLLKPEVKAAFAQTANPSSKALAYLYQQPSLPEIHRPQKGILKRMRSFVSSVRYYCFDSLVGTNNPTVSDMSMLEPRKTEIVEQKKE
ncbi:MAG TPA: serine/threonine-protein kinase [Gemmataceae bacterium]|nr:serine/threonine-protein kinase [Gemmataceae bacterium]